MGRTLHYRVLSERQLPPEIWHVIESVQDSMNERFTCTCENIKLQPVSEADRKRGDHNPNAPSDAPVQAYGFTKVLADEWNAVLVVRFVQWLSALLPHSKVELHDEGDYVLCGNLIFEAGEPRPDGACIAQRCDYLKGQGYSDVLKQLAEAVQYAVLHGFFFTKYPASEYADRMELAALKLPDGLAGLSLGDVAERMQFPWQDEAS